ncbi:MAG: hypothetical protein IPJ35_03135 [Elusimicrobia bacterium]|nr:hypothetical protein [Elusimicrobiota bacterium]
MKQLANHTRLARRSFGALTAVGLLLAASSAQAWESSNATQRLTRDEVNAGGDFHATGGVYTLSGSVDYIQNSGVSVGGAFKGAGGVQSVMYYPNNVASLSLSSTTLNYDSQIRLDWVEPAIFHDDTPGGVTVGGYRIRQLQGATMSEAQFNSGATTDVAGVVPSPSGVGTTLNHVATGLSYNRSYTFGIRAHDPGNADPRGEAYRIFTQTRATLPRLPTIVSVLPVANKSKQLDVTFNMQNPNPDNLFYEVQVARDIDFTVGVKQKSNNSIASGNLTVRFGDGGDPLQQNTLYYARVRTRGVAVVFTPYSLGSGTTGAAGVGIVLTGADPSSISVTVTNNEFGTESRPEWSSDGNNPWSSTVATTSVASYSATLTGLFANTTYYVRAALYDPHPSLLSTATLSAPNYPLVTGVLNPFPQVTGGDTTSMTLNWLYPLANNGAGGPVPGSYSYLFQISKDDFASVASQQRVFFAGSQPGDHTFSSLDSNTLYKTSVTAFNRLGTNTYSEAASRILFPAYYTAPNTPNSGSFGVTADPTSKVKVVWGANGNSASTSYRVELSIDNFATLVATQTVPGAFEYTFEAPIHNVLANQEYFVRVKALPIAGSDKTDSPYLVIGSTFTRPLEARLLTVTPGENTMAITFSSATTNGVAKNNAITQYRFSWSDGGSSFGSVFPIDLPTLSGVTPSNLIKNSTYTLMVETVRHPSSGWSNVSISSARVTLAGTPDFLVPFVHITSVTARWSSNANSPGTLYESLIANNPNILPVLTSSMTRNVFATYEGLIPNTFYYFKTRAISHEGIATLFDPDHPATEPAYQVATFPQSPLILDYVTPDEFQLTLNWSGQSNNPITNYRVRHSSVSVLAVASTSYDTPAVFFSSSVPNLDPDTMHYFQVRADYINDSNTSSATVVSATCTLAQVPQGLDVRSFAGATAMNVNISIGRNRPLTEYAFEMLDHLNNSLGFMEFYLDASAKAIRLKSSNPFVKDWAPLNLLAEKSTDPGEEELYFFKVTGLVNNPSQVKKLRAYARNQLGRETTYSAALPLIFPSGPPVVTLNTFMGVYYATRTVLGDTDVYYSTDAVDGPISFLASGSGHYNVAFNQSAPLAPTMLVDFQNQPGWNGDIGEPSDACWAPVPGVGALNNTALRFCTGSTEGIYYLHIVGDRLNAASVDLPKLIENFPPGAGANQSYFRVKVDLTRPDPGAVRAFADGFEIPNVNPERYGFQNVIFTWWPSGVDNGNPVSRSPIIGWSYSFSTNALDVPVQSTSGVKFINHPTVSKTLFVGDLGPIPDEETYYFKVIGVDRAGNWTGAPQVFTYNFKKDVVEPHFVEVSLTGHRLPKGAANEFHYAAVDPTAPLRITFTEPMNLLGAGAVQFVKTHDAAGNQTSVSVPFASNANVIDATTTVMEVTAAFEYGARYEFITSTTNLRDLGGNRLPAAEKFSVVFFTLADGGPMTIRSGVPGQEVRLEVAAGALGLAPTGLAFDDNVANDGHPVGQMVTRANGAMARRSGGVYNQVLTAKEFVQYEPDGTKVTTPVLAPVRIVFPYDFLDQDGATNDGKLSNVPSGRPIYEDRLAIYKLDERSGAWIKMPGTLLDPGLKEASLQVQSFGIYALMGAPSFSLTDAHPFPVPYRASEDNGSGITFVFPGAQIATVKIFTLDGRLVKTLHENSGAGLVSWYPVNTDGGEPVGSDVYIYAIENDQDRRVGKLVIIR